MDRGGDHLARREALHEKAHRRHVRYGVQCSDLVEVYLRHGHAVDRALRPGDEAVHGEHVGLHLLRDMEPRHDMLYPVHIVVVMALMVMVVPFRLRAVDADGDMRPGNAAFDGGLPDILDAGDARGVQRREGRLRVGHELQKRRRQHIPGSAHPAVDIQRFHAPASLLCK